MGETAFGTEPTFHLGRDRDALGVVFRSCPPGLLRRPSSFTSLHTTPSTSLRHHRGMPAGEVRRWWWPGTVGEGQSEVKEEDPRSGSGGHERRPSPSGPGSRRTRNERPRRAATSPFDEIPHASTPTSRLRRHRPMQAQDFIRKWAPGATHTT